MACLGRPRGGPHSADVRLADGSSVQAELIVEYAGPRGWDGPGNRQGPRRRSQPRRHWPRKAGRGPGHCSMSSDARTLEGLAAVIDAVALIAHHAAGLGDGLELLSHVQQRELSCSGAKRPISFFPSSGDRSTEGAVLDPGLRARYIPGGSGLRSPCRALRGHTLVSLTHGVRSCQLLT